MTENKLRHTFKALLKPALKLLLRHSIRLPEIVELIKEILTEISYEDIKKSGHAPSASRVSAMTGVHRKDIARFKKEDPKTPDSKNLIARVMVQWQHHSNFITKAGKPRVLTAEGKSSQFADLVNMVNGGNISCYAVLFEMERMGIIERVRGGVKLIWRDFSPSVDTEEAYQMLAEDGSDLFRAVQDNVESKNAHLHLKTEFDRIDSEALPEIRKWIVEQGSRFQRQVRTYLAQFDADTSGNTSPRHTARVAVGAFSFCEETEL